MDLFQLTRTLIDIRSTTGMEAEMMRFLSEYLEDLGFNVKKQTVGLSTPPPTETETNHTAGQRFNVLATMDEPEVILSTHTDTVNPYFERYEDDQDIYGRGACDTKGIIAAQLKAVEKLLEEGIRNVGFLFVVGEETISDGAIAANGIPNSCRWLINGEPTENKMAVGTKGVMRIKLNVTGKSCHSAYPEMGESAIDKILDILNDIRKHDWPSHDLLGDTTCNIGTISGGVQSNVVAPSAEAELMFRVVTDTEEIEQQLKAIVDNRGQMDFYFGYQPVITHVVDGFDTMIASYGTDVPFLNNWGMPVLFGPGSILDAHTAKEKINKTQLQNSVDHYAVIIRQLLAI